jgi:hypothetical protein
MAFPIGRLWLLVKRWLDHCSMIDKRRHGPPRVCLLRSVRNHLFTFQGFQIPSRWNGRGQLFRSYPRPSYVPILGPQIKTPAENQFRERFQDGGGRRTRTFEAIRRLIYSQLPLPLGTLPRLTSSAPHAPELGGWTAMDDGKKRARSRAPGRRVYGRSSGVKSTNGARFMTPFSYPSPSRKLPRFQARETSGA